MFRCLGNIKRTEINGCEVFSNSERKGQFFDAKVAGGKFFVSSEVILKYFNQNYPFNFIFNVASNGNPQFDYFGWARMLDTNVQGTAVAITVNMIRDRNKKRLLRRKEIK